MQKLFSDIFSFFTENRCAYCDEIFHTNQSTNIVYGLCPVCISKLSRYTSNYCTNCGKIPSDTSTKITLSQCEHCINTKIIWDKLIFYGIYENLLQELIKKAKFNENLIFTRTLADLILPLFQELPHFDFIVPMPLHNKRLQERGYNQCVEITKYINKKSGYTYNTQALIKTRHTKSQSTLKQSERKTNLQNAFFADKELVNGKTILLLDDVATTGSTLFWATKALKKAGASKVFVLYIAGTKAY